jgi:hypothetical protein
LALKKYEFLFASTLIGHKMDLKFVEDYKYLHKKIIELERFFNKALWGYFGKISSAS